MIKIGEMAIKLLSLVKTRLYFKFASLFIGFCCLFLFQNCENFGAFVAFDELSSSDPHKDSWRPVDGVEVKNGEWVKVEEQIQEKLRLTDRIYISSKISNIAIFGDETSSSNLAIKYKINDLVTRQIANFGGPCIYNNPESIKISSASNGIATCSGIALEQVMLDYIPAPSVFRSSSKQAICDYLSSEVEVQKNIKGNLEIISNILGSENIPYLVHQLFYLGSEPRRRTIASLEALYKTAASSSNIAVTDLDDRALKLVTLAVCHSNGWESP